MTAQQIAAAGTWNLLATPLETWSLGKLSSNPQLGLMMTRANAYSFGV
jgi:hypothetical protein